MELAAGDCFTGELSQGTLIVGASEIKCQHSVILKDFDNPAPFGDSPKIVVQAVIVPATNFTGKIEDSILRRGLRCTILISSGLKFELIIWTSSIFNGGGVYQFLLVDLDFHA